MGSGGGHWGWNAFQGGANVGNGACQDVGGGVSVGHGACLEVRGGVFVSVWIFFWGRF